MPRKIIKKVWTHDALCADLASWIGADGFVCSEVRFGRAWKDAAAIPDVLKIRKSYTRFDVQIMEVKSHRSDFLGELRLGKWLEYIPMCSRFYFCTPYWGVVNDESEIPEGAGWMVRHPSGWKIKQASQIRLNFTPSPDQMLALLMSVDDRRKEAELENNRLRSLKHIHNARKNAQMLHRLQRVEEYMDGTWRVRENLMAARDKFCEITGFSKAASFHEWTSDLERRLLTAQGSAPVTDLKMIQNGLQRVMRKLETMLPPETPTL